MRIFKALTLWLLVCTTACSPTPGVSPDQTFDITEDMVMIPAGKFQRGCDALGPEHGAPAHDVYLNAFMIDKYEVTNKKLEEVMPDHLLRRSASSSCDNCPVSKITWYEAADYCHLIGKALPSEAQWEKAAGGANGCEFPWGPDWDPAMAYGGKQLADNAAPVGQYPPNQYGLYDMAGNMWEWVADWYSPRFYFLGELMYNPRGPRRGVMKVRRGGAWSDSINGMLVGYRDWSYPFSRSFSDIGFRCVINLKPPS
ncbi:formylglycine-generating enzyme family protein [Nitrospina sp. 32_T5]|uniref:formylglycine-generating enzyme family protein n=1 Tax=unclassified Nitrospina TaxID=2638683 RepID=UPI003F9D7FCB